MVFAKWWTRIKQSSNSKSTPARLLCCSAIGFHLIIYITFSLSLKYVNTRLLAHSKIDLFLYFFSSFLRKSQEVLIPKWKVSKWALRLFSSASVRSCSISTNKSLLLTAKWGCSLVQECWVKTNSIQYTEEAVLNHEANSLSKGNELTKVINDTGHPAPQIGRTM